MDEQPPMTGPGKLARLVERLRQAPAERRQMLALAGAAGVTLLFVGAVFAWRLAFGEGGESGYFAAGVGQLLGAVGGVFGSAFSSF